ncbi:hypothetical protein [Agrobacterium sp. OT33]|uniref:hypothetical protein n=1 Tax=Agrobacterium sp. OT33 TaxID=2815338 RepID=UPI001A8CA09A|nr:hypothetical protein [Agrobacterium sp. OT33]MBO0125104.1 hypothetical protein [Agrobacterium sp. OT33]
MNSDVHSTAVPANPARPYAPATFTPPATLLEALAFDRAMEADWVPELEQHFLANWQGIVDGKFPITSNFEAAALIQKMLSEFEDSDPDFVQKISRQVIDFLQGDQPQTPAPNARS